MGQKRKVYRPIQPPWTPDHATLLECVFGSCVIRDIPRRLAAAKGQQGPGYERKKGGKKQQAALSKLKSITQQSILSEPVLPHSPLTVTKESWGVGCRLSSQKHHHAWQHVFMWVQHKWGNSGVSMGRRGSSILTPLEQLLILKTGSNYSLFNVYELLATLWQE